MVTVILWLVCTHTPDVTLECLRRSCEAPSVEANEIIALSGNVSRAGAVLWTIRGPIQEAASIGYKENVYWMDLGNLSIAIKPQHTENAL